MKLKNIGKLALTAGNKMKWGAKKYSPELCLIGGFITGVMCVVEACKATKKAVPVLEAHKKEVEEAAEYLEENPDNFSEAEKSRYVRHIYVHTGVKLVKCYALPVAYGLLSGGLFLSGYLIQRGRNLSLLAALAAERAKQLPEGEGQKLLESGENDISEEEKKDDEEQFGEMDPRKNPYSFFFGEGVDGPSYSWLDVKQYGPLANPHQLEVCELEINRLLPVKLIFTPNDLRRMFGLRPDIRFQSAGIVFDPKKGDHQFSLGIHNTKNKKMMAFMNGDETDGCFICPNFEPYILDKKLPTLREMEEYYARGGQNK